MDLFSVAIFSAMLVTVVIMFAGLLTMSGGGTTNVEFSTPLMWTRVGSQALTIALLITAALAR